jgi:uncharacterized protein YndB with AHSA1/START domain
MSKPMRDPRTIRVDEFLPHSPARVWRALTEPELLAKWLAPNDFRLVTGHRFVLRMDPIPAVDFDGNTYCRVLDFEVPRRLRISWGDEPGGLNTTVTWTLEPEGRGTRLFTVHDGFDPDDPLQQRARRGMGGGWPGVIGRLVRCLDDVIAREA